MKYQIVRAEQLQLGNFYTDYYGDAGHVYKVIDFKGRHPVIEIINSKYMGKDNRVEIYFPHDFRLIDPPVEMKPEDWL